MNYRTEQASNTVSSSALVVGLFVVHLSGARVDNHQISSYTPLNPGIYLRSATPSSFDQYRGIITGEYQQQRDPAEGIISEKFNPLIEQLNSWVDSIKLPNKWETEGIRPPTLECRKLAKSVTVRLLKTYRLYPSRVSATIEEGVFINYINHVNRSTLSIEAYNDLDLAAIVTRDKEIILSADISDENFKEVIQVFNARQIP